MLLLALDTSTSAVTVALRDDSGALAETSVLDARAHAEHLAPGIAAVLAEAGRRAEEVTHVVTGIGPGPFTGLRVGIVTALTFAEVVGAQVGGVCSLDAMAHQAWSAGEIDGEVVVATDARRKEVYWARYTTGPDGVRRRSGPDVTRPADLPAEVATLPCIGRGPLLYPDALGPALAPLDVSAAALADLAAHRIAAGEGLEEPAPLYLRRPDAQPPSAPKSVSLPGPRAGR